MDIFEDVEAEFEKAKEAPLKAPVPVRAAMSTGAPKPSTPEDDAAVTRNQYGQTPAEEEALRLELRRMWEPDVEAP